MDLEVAILRRDSVPVVAIGVPYPFLTGVSPSTAMAARLWHDMRFANVFSPILHETQICQLVYHKVKARVSGLTWISSPQSGGAEPSSVY
jgi:hypothetical protein